MLRFVGSARSCPGPVGRRSFLQAGTLALGGLTLADLLRSEASADPGRRARQKSVIYIVLAGGPSHIDMYDPKPAAPSEYRGPLRTISTSLPGVQFSELLPHQASDLHNLALLRGIQSVENDHYLSEVYSGLPRSAGQRPAFGTTETSGGLHSSASTLPPDGIRFRQPTTAANRPAKTSDCESNSERQRQSFDRVLPFVGRTEIERQNGECRGNRLQGTKTNRYGCASGSSKLEGIKSQVSGLLPWSITAIARVLQPARNRTPPRGTIVIPIHLAPVNV